VESVFRIINEQTRAPGEDIVARVLNEGQIVALANHTALLARDGREIPIEDSAAPIRDSSGTVSGVVLVFHDVTERRRAEEQMRGLTQRLTYHVDHSPLAVIEWGPDMRLVRWSGAAERLFGWKAGEVLGKRMEDFHWVYHEDEPQVAEVSGDLQSGANPRRFSSNRNYCKDGSVVHCEWYNSSLVSASGKLLSILSLVLDVTARQRAEEAIRQSEARYHTLFDTMIEGFCVIEVVFDAQNRPVDYRFLEINPAFERQTGLHNAKGRLMRELAPEHEAHWFEIYGKVALTGEPARFVNEARALGRWYEVSAYRVGGAESRRVAILFNDITQSQRAEAARAQLAAIVESSDDAILSKDLDGTITSWNVGAERLFGYGPEEVIGRPITLLLPPERQDEETGIMVRLQAGERVEHFETVRVAKDGRSLPVSVTISPLKDGGGRVIGASKIVRDITERQRAEQQLRLLSTAVESAANGIAVTDRNGAILWINPAFTRLTGYSRAEAVGQNPRILKSGRHAPEFYRQMWSTLLKGEPWHGELVNRRKDGSLHPEEITITPVQTGGGEITHFVAIKQDITRRKRAERRTELLAEAASRLLNSDDPQSVVDELCGKVLEFLDCQVSFNFLVDDKQQRLRLNSCAGIPQLDAAQIEWLDCCGALCGHPAQDGCRLVARSIQETDDPRTGLVRPYGIQAYACHPLMVAGRLLGTLSFGKSRPGTVRLCGLARFAGAAPGGGRLCETAATPLPGESWTPRREYIAGAADGAEPHAAADHRFAGLLARRHAGRRLCAGRPERAAPTTP
jgi:PAS domain S-box-containing protein